MERDRRSLLIEKLVQGGVFKAIRPGSELVGVLSLLFLLLFFNYCLTLDKLLSWLRVSFS